MVKNNYLDPDPPASRGVVYPEVRLLAGILTQSFFDFRSRDPVKSVDALLFFLDPEGGETFLEAMGYQLEPYKILDILSGGEIYAKKNQLKRFAFQYVKKHERKRKTEICQGS
jgi:hypothetical protein